MALSYGLPADTDPADTMLLQHGQDGNIHPAKSIIDDYNRALSVLKDEQDKKSGVATAEEAALKARQAREAQTLAQGGTIRKRT